MSIQLTISRASAADAPLLAPMNKRLIDDEGHRNAMNVEQLTERMRGWLAGEYEAHIATHDNRPIAYCLFVRHPDHIYIRQLFVERDARKQGIGSQLLEHLKTTAWKGVSRLRIEVLVSNPSGITFWRRVGFNDYCITMELNSEQT